MRYLKIGIGPARRRIAVLVLATTMLFAVPAAAQAYWGAIAVNPATGAYGVSYNYNTANGAKHRALNECKGQKCRVAVWVRNGWAALVFKNKNNVFVAGAGDTEREAVAKARSRAHDSSARKVTTVYSG